MNTEQLNCLEEWRHIAGYEGIYEISNIGRVRTSKKLIRKPQKWANGYLHVVLFAVDRKPKGVSIHRTVALAFIPNPNKKGFVNHINGNKTDNRISNLEWCSHKENMAHALATGLWKPWQKRPTNLIDKL